VKNPDIIKIKDKTKASFWRIVFGYTFVLIGFMGIILPVLPGWPFLFLGIFVLGGEEGLRKAFVKYLPKSISGRLNKYMDKIYGWSKK